MPTNREIWEQAFAESRVRDVDYTTMSGIPLDPVYGPGRRVRATIPGSIPYTRGPYASMYRSKLWTMRMFAGFGTADDTNWRFKEIIKSGGDGSVDGIRHADAAWASTRIIRWRWVRSVGAVWRSIRWPTWRICMRGSTSTTTTTSMTINSPAAVIMAMYVAQAEKAGVDRARLGGTLQNDILKEYQAQKEFVFPPRPSMRLVRDTIRFTAAEMPRWHSISISGYHIREAGSTAVEELAFTLANGFAYVELATAGRLAGRLVRAAVVVLLQRPHRLLRRDRQVPRRPADLGALAARPLRGDSPSVRCSCGSTPRPPACR